MVIHICIYVIKMTQCCSCCGKSLRTVCVLIHVCVCVFHIASYCILLCVFNLCFFFLVQLLWYNPNCKSTIKIIRLNNSNTSHRSNSFPLFTVFIEFMARGNIRGMSDFYSYLHSFKTQGIMFIMSFLWYCLDYNNTKHNSLTWWIHFDDPALTAVCVCVSLTIPLKLSHGLLGNSQHVIRHSRDKWSLWGEHDRYSKHHTHILYIPVVISCAFVPSCCSGTVPDAEVVAVMADLHTAGLQPCELWPPAAQTLCWTSVAAHAAGYSAALQQTLSFHYSQRHLSSWEILQGRHISTENKPNMNIRHTDIQWSIRFWWV